MASLRSQGNNGCVGVFYSLFIATTRHSYFFSFFLFNIKIYKTRYLRLLDYKLLNYITRTITREARNHDYPKGHLGRNPINFDQIPTVLDSWIFVDVGYVGFGKVMGILP